MQILQCILKKQYISEFIYSETRWFSVANGVHQCCCSRWIAVSLQIMPGKLHQTSKGASLGQRLAVKAFALTVFRMSWMAQRKKNYRAVLAVLWGNNARFEFSLEFLERWIFLTTEKSAMICILSVPTNYTSPVSDIQSNVFVFIIHICIHILYGRCKPRPLYVPLTVAGA